MKKCVCALLVPALLFLFAGCSSVEKPGEAGQGSADPIITVYFDAAANEALYHLPFEYKLTEWDKEVGFLSVEKKSDGVAMYTIKQSDYQDLLDEILRTVKALLDKAATKNVPTVKSITYNDTLTEIVIAVERADFENISFEQDAPYAIIINCISGCGNNVVLYHCYSTGEFTSCTVKVVDSATGDTLASRVYPDFLKEIDR